MTLHIGSGLSTLPDTLKATRSAAKRASAALKGRDVDLAIMFFTPHHLDTIEEGVAYLLGETSGKLLGCTTQAVIAEGQEIEEGPGMAVWFANVDGAPIETFSVALEQTPDGDALIGFPLLDDAIAGAVLLGDPFSFPTQALLAGLNGDHPGLPIVGGMASGANSPGEHALIHDDTIRYFGAVGATFGAPLKVQPVVSQGCKPIGEPFSITACDGPVVYELGGKPPLEVLREAVKRLPPEEQEKVRDGVLAGLVLDEYRSDLKPGDFLIRNISRANTSSGAVVIGEYVHTGQTMQFQVRDGRTADEELKQLLASHRGEGHAGALMFSCNGRGGRMFGDPHHDAQMLETCLGPVPTAGMFCNGEIGPVSGRNFVHGFTSSIALLSEDE